MTKVALKREPEHVKLIVQTHLRISLNLTVAAQWNIMLVQFMRFSLSSSLRAMSTSVRSLATAIIFSLNSGCSSLNLSKSCQKKTGPNIAKSEYTRSKESVMTARQEYIHIPRSTVAVFSFLKSSF